MAEIPQPADWGRVVGMLFCDLVDSTLMQSVQGIEVSEEIRRNLFEALREVIDPIGGEEVKNLGDGLMVVFPNVPSDAIACAAAMQQAVKTLNRVSDYPDASIRIGLGSGRTVYDSEEDDWFGPTVNLAARLCSAASGDEVYLPAAMAGESTWWTFDPVDELDLKGIPEPVPTVSLRWAETPQHLRPPSPLFDPRHGLGFAGRTEQLRALEAEAKGARGVHLVQLVGPPGSGTTRLLQEWVSSLPPSTDVLALLHHPGSDLAETIARAGRWERRRAGALRGAQLTARDPISTEATPARHIVVAIDGADGLSASGIMSHLGALSAAENLVMVTTRHTPGLAMGTVIEVGPLTGGEIQQMLLSARPRLDHSEVLSEVVRSETDGNAAHATEACCRLLGEHDRAPLELDELTTWAQAVVRRTRPYRGLESFGVDDRPLFFGRDNLIDALVRQVESAPVVALVGPSGSGKSSVLAAGLAASIEERSGVEWSCVRITPGTDPLTAVRGVIETIERGESEGSSEPGRWLVVIDQFEELFTLTSSDETRQRVIDSVFELTERFADVRAVLGVRADHYQDAMRDPSLREVLQDHQVLAGPLDAPEVRAIIEGPARVAGLRLEDGLVETLIADLEEHPGSLPLLSHALYETWRRRSGRTLTLAGYLAAGRVEGAIADTAEREYGSLPAESQSAARRLFLRLVSVDGGGSPSRRPVPISELAADLAAVAERFTAARLTVVDSTTVGVGHESLLRAWPRLAGWIESDRESIAMRSQLSASTQAWISAGRNDGDLYRGARLDSVSAWAAGRREDLGADELDFLDRSRTRAEEQIATERRLARRTRVLLGVVSMLLVLAVLAGIIALAQRNDAQRQSEIAETRQREAELRSLVAESSNLAATDPSLAILLAAEAFARTPGDTTEGALLEVLAAQNERIRTWEPPVAASDCDGWLHTATDGSSVYFGHGEEVLEVDPLDGSTSTTSDRPTECANWYTDGSFKYAHDASKLWVAPASQPFGEAVEPDDSGLQVTAISPARQAGELAVLLSPAPGSEGTPAQQLVLASAESESINEAVRVRLPPGSRELAISASGAIAAVGSTAERKPRQANPSVITVADREGNSTQVEVPAEPTAMAFSPDEERLVVGDDSGRVSVHSVANLEHLGEPLGPGGLPVKSVAFDDRGQLLVTNTGNVRFFDASLGYVTRNRIAAFRSAEIRHRGDGLLVSVADSGAIELYDPMGGPLVRQSAPFDRTRFLDYSTDGRFAVGLNPFEQKADVLDTVTGERMSLELPLEDRTSLVSAALPIDFSEQRGITTDLRAVRWTDGRVVETVALESEAGFTLLGGDRNETHAAVVGVHPDGRARAYLTDLQSLESVHQVDLEGPSSTALPLDGSGIVLFDKPGMVTVRAIDGTDLLSAPVPGTPTTAAAHLNTLLIGTEEGLVVAVDMDDRSSEIVATVDSRVMDVAFVRNGSRVIVADDSNVASLWNLDTKQKIGVVASGIEERVNNTYSPPESSDTWVNYLDHGVMLDLDPSTLLDRACKVAGHAMTDTERDTYLGSAPAVAPCS